MSKNSTLEIGDTYVQGTVKELTKGDRLRVNGKKVDQPASKRPRGTKGTECPSNAGAFFFACQVLTLQFNQL